MASYRRLPSGLWQAQIFRRGIRKSDTFPSKGAAVAWAGRTEDEIMSGVRGEIPKLTVKELFDRYERDVSSNKKGKRWEIIRLQALGRDRIASVSLRQLDTPHLSDWQERRLKKVSSASVRRERNLLNNVFQLAVNEWHWLRKNPFKGVRRPKDGRHRNRLATQEEIDQLISKNGAMSLVIEFALETGMRASEIANLKDVRGRVAHLVDSKNGEARDVPLSSRAVELWNGGFGLTAGSISALFAQRCSALKIKGLTFHDLRHTAATRIAEKLDLFELCKMFGWKDPRHALVYYNKSAAHTANKL